MKYSLSLHHSNIWTFWEYEEIKLYGDVCYIDKHEYLGKYKTLKQAIGANFVL